MGDAPIPDWVSQHAGQTPDAPALVFDGVVATYAELDKAAARSAEELRSQGIEAGSLVPIAAVSLPGTVVSLVAGPRVGAVVAPFGPTPPQGVLDRSAGAYAVVTTSGSSGDPKGVMLTTSNVTAAISASQARLGNDAGDRWLLCLPLYHIAGLSLIWRSLSAGGSVLIHDRFDAVKVAAALKSGEASMASLVPTMLHRVLDIDPGPYRDLKAVLLGGGPATRDLVQRALDAGLPVLPTYGMTETASQMATVAPGDEREALGTVGHPLDGMVVTFEDGEILVEGPAVSPGYLGEPARSGPHHTHDIGYFDAEGRLVVTGRIDDIILSGGEKVVPQHVEAVLESFPGIERAVVLGVADDDWGQAAVAVIEGDPIDEAALGARARAALPTHEVPKRWVRVEELPLLPSGKIDRSAAASMLTEGGAT
jgi:O-succinylbenzoic acid--CoA ligase